MIDHIHDPLASKFTYDMRDSSGLTKVACDDLANEDLSSLPDSAFAHPIQFGERFYPCHTPEHVTLSRAYLHKYPDGMSAETFGKVAAHLEDAAEAFGLNPWSDEFLKQAEDPVDEVHQLATDMLDFERNYRQMMVDSRRNTALSLYKRAESLDKTASLPYIVRRYAFRHLKPDYMQAIEDRRRHFADRSPMWDRLFHIGRNARALGVENVLRMLREFDEENGLTAHYDGSLLDPYLSLLGDEPPPPACVYRDGDCEICDDDITPENLRAKLGDLVNGPIIQALGMDFCDAIEKVRPEIKVVIIRAIAKPKCCGQC